MTRGGVLKPQPHNPHPGRERRERKGGRQTASWGPGTTVAPRQIRRRPIPVTPRQREGDGAKERGSERGPRNSNPCQRPSQPRPATMRRLSPSPATTSSSIDKRAKMVGLLQV